MKTKFTEEQIQEILNYLQRRHPERATRKRAIEILKLLGVAKNDIEEAVHELIEKEGKLPEDQPVN